MLFFFVYVCLKWVIQVISLCSMDFLFVTQSFACRYTHLHKVLLRHVGFPLSCHNTTTLLGPNRHPHKGGQSLNLHASFINPKALLLQSMPPLLQPTRGSRFHLQEAGCAPLLQPTPHTTLADFCCSSQRKRDPLSLPSLAKNELPQQLSRLDIRAIPTQLD